MKFAVLRAANVSYLSVWAQCPETRKLLFFAVVRDKWCASARAGDSAYKHGYVMEPACAHCGQVSQKHSGGRCLFSADKFEPMCMEMDPPDFVPDSALLNRIFASELLGG